ncbi:MAG TPA: amino acid adenylation domain-containing protein [Acidobacteriaceae bacterium]|jgi:amino acid adenylation domain-containing protein
MISAARTSQDGIDERLREQRLRAAAAARQANRIQPRTPGAKVPISAEQYRIWLHSSQQPDMPLYNEAITIHKRGSFDLKTLEAAFNEILRRHEAWRTSFALVDGELLQVVHPDLHVELPLVDLSGLPPEEREAEALRLATEDAKKPISLEHAPLFRPRVVRMEAEEHRFLLTLHHIIFDGVSIYRTLMPELAATYAAFECGVKPELPELQLQYGDYSIWRQQHLESAGVKEHIAYWREQLAGELPVLRLPVDRPRPAEISSRGSMECFQLSAERIRALRELSRAHGVTLYMTLLAAFKTLLFRYSAQEDVIVGGATDARRRMELEPLMGYFLDTFAVRTRPTADKKFSAYLREVKYVVLEALDAADVPFDRVVQEVNPRRDNSHHPIFQAFFSIEPPVAPFADGWDLTQMDVTVGSSKFDLYLELDERPDHMAARFMYNTDIFDAVTIRRMAGHWQQMLESVCRTPDATLGELPFLTAGEMEQLAGPGGWNDTAQPIPQATLHRLIEEQAARTSQSVAAVLGSERWTYAELLARANELADALRAAGAGPGTLVAVFLQRSLDLLAGLIAVAKTGAAYVPMDPETPQARIALCLDDAKPVAVLTSASLLEMLGDYANRSVLVDRTDTSAGSQETPRKQDFEETPGSENETAYVIHTSGTTGKPKAVEIAHRSLVNLLLSVQREIGFGPDDVLLAVTTVSFDIAALELFLPLISGGTVLMASRDEVKDPYLLAARIEDAGCTVMQATPSTWRALLQTGWKGSSRPLRVLCGGEPLPRALADRLLATGVALWNMYGPTETTVWSTLHRVGSGGEPVPVGKPIANTTAYVLDERGQLQPVNVPGELLLGGAGVAKGYRGQPEMTAEKFVTLKAIGPARVYRTGDLAVRRADGRLECVGRIDNQVKVRGFRVELEAVETAVQMHPQVAAAAARVWVETDGGTRLSLYVMSRNGTPPETRTLRQFLQTSLPEYMVPSDIIALPAIPLTPNGKIDRKALPRPSATRFPDHAPSLNGGFDLSRPSGVESGGSEATLEMPQPGIEAAIASVWCDVLNLKELGRHDNFFELGGHSLEAVRCVSLVNRALGSSIRFASFLQAPTIAQLASIVRGGPAPKVQLVKRGSPASKRLLWIGTGEWLTFFAKRLTIDVTLYGVAPDIERLTDRSVEAMTAQILPDVLKLQGGPFVIGGFCLRGLLALELARRLNEEGADVELLILGDVYAPQRVPEWTLPQRIIRRAHRESWNLWNALRSPAGQRLPALRRLLVSWREWRDVNLDDPDIPDELLQALYITGPHYEPSRFQGRVLFLESGENRMVGISTSQTWSEFIQDIEVSPYPGIHENFLFESYLDALATRIENAIER